MPKKIEKTVYTFGELLEASKDKSSGVTDRAVEKARVLLSQKATDHQWWDCTYEDYEQALEQVGFDGVKINFSGFWSQGDGACFTASVDLPKLIDFLSFPPKADNPQPLPSNDDKMDWRPWVVQKAEGVRSNPKFQRLKWILDYVEMEIKNNDSRYSHKNTCYVENDFRDNGEYVDGPLERGYPTRVWKSKQPRLRKLWDEFCVAVETLRDDLCDAIYKDLESEHDYLTTDEHLIEDSKNNDEVFDEQGRPE